MPAALPEGRGGSAPSGAGHFFHGEKVTKTPLRGMKLSALIAKGRRTVLKISPPKNPQNFTGAAIWAGRQLSAARGRGTASALIPADADLALAPDFAALDTCAALRCCLPVRRDPAPAGENRPGRRGPGGESAGITIQAAPSETEGAEVGAEASDVRAPERGRCTALYAPGVLRGRSP